jgi:5,10-methenyltetrahydrofolate synthetase
MTSSDDEGAGGGFASPPCFLHEIDPAYAGLPEAEDPRQRSDVRRWRKAERARLIEARLALATADRHRFDRRIAEGVEAAIAAAVGEVAGRIVSAYWPFRGEPNLRPLLGSLSARGARCALPAVVARGQPLVFRAWSPGEPLARGVWNIPVPPESAETVTPEVVIAPVVGFDRLCYRLGYGGGFYDRTLANLPDAPRVFGVGYGLAEIPTVYPQWHDVPMHAVVTETGTVEPGGTRD